MTLLNGFLGHTRKAKARLFVALPKQRHRRGRDHGGDGVFVNYLLKTALLQDDNKAVKAAHNTAHLHTVNQNKVMR